jgi:membrane protease YdiL (CAAX protease family)
MPKFILNRPNDYLTLSRRKIFFTALKALVLLMLSAIMFRIACISFYFLKGINPMELTKFGGDPTTYIGNATWKTIVKLMLVAPVLEEVMFRLGLSFKYKTVALWLGLLPVVCAFYLFHCRDWYLLLGLIGLGVLLSCLVVLYTKDKDWDAWRSKYIIPAMWISAVSFGLVHFMAFSVLNLQVFPFALATILVPMAGGCAVTYARVNLGFWWGVLFHCMINIPPVLMIVSTM